VWRCGLGGGFADADADDGARFLQPEDESKHGRFYHITERMFQSMLNAYETGLKWVLRHQFSPDGAVATLVATIWLYIIVPKGLLPHRTRPDHRRDGCGANISFKSMVERHT